jgi:predicted dehydrogenase
LKIKALINNGDIGDIRFVDVKIHKSLHPDIVGQSQNINNWRTQLDIAGGGYFYDLAAHQLDFLDYLFGPIVQAHGIAKNCGGLYKTEDTTLGTFVFENGVVGMGSWCFSVSKEVELEKTIIYGSKGSIEFPFFVGFDVTVKIDGQPTKLFKFEMPENIQLPLIQTIVDELNGIGKCPSTGVSGARTNWVLEQMCKRIDQ